MNKFDKKDDDGIEGGEEEEEKKEEEQEEKKEEPEKKIEKEKSEGTPSGAKGIPGMNKENEDFQKVELPNENTPDFREPVKSFFKNVKIVKNESKFTTNQLDNFGESYGMFYCNTKFGDELFCDQTNLLSCPKCMKLNQKMYGLKPHYLLNDKGRVCTYKRNQIYCNGKFLKEADVNGIVYSYNYVCGHSGHCDACKRLSKHFDKYYDKNLLEKLRKRDEMSL
jgi:hypothetical protein